jgi:hypothetical protein
MTSGHKWLLLDLQSLVNWWLIWLRCQLSYTLKCIDKLWQNIFYYFTKSKDIDRNKVILAVFLDLKRAFETINRGLMRSTHVLSVEVLAGLLPIRQRLSFLNERFLVSALVKPNDLLTKNSIESETIRTAFPNSKLSVRVGWYLGRTFLRSWTSTWWIWYLCQRCTTVCR